MIQKLDIFQILPSVKELPNFETNSPYSKDNSGSDFRAFLTDASQKSEPKNESSFKIEKPIESDEPILENQRSVESIVESDTISTEYNHEESKEAQKSEESILIDKNNKIVEESIKSEKTSEENDIDTQKLNDQIIERDKNNGKKLVQNPETNETNDFSQPTTYSKFLSNAQITESLIDKFPKNIEKNEKNQFITKKEESGISVQLLTMLVQAKNEPNTDPIEKNKDLTTLTSKNLKKTPSIERNQNIESKLSITHLDSKSEEILKNPSKENETKKNSFNSKIEFGKFSNEANQTIVLDKDSNNKVKTKSNENNSKESKMDRLQPQDSKEIILDKNSKKLESNLLGKIGNTTPSNDSGEKGMEGQSGKSSNQNSNELVSEKNAIKVEPKFEVKSSTNPEQIQRNFQELVKTARIQIVENGKNSAEITMQPKELGKITLLMVQENDKIEGKLLVENETVRSALFAELGNLKEDLKANGLDLQELTIEIDTPNSSFTQFEKDEEETGKKAKRTTGSELLDTDNEDEPSIGEDRILDIKV
jgi:flagellar hook-length control protein FliK